MLYNVFRRTLPAFAFAALAGAAAADPADDCQNVALDDAMRLAACNVAIAEATDPAEQGDHLADRAGAHRRLGDVEAARADIEEAMRLAPEDADPWIERGYLLRDEGDSARAVEALEQAVALEPDYWRAVLVAMDLLPDAGHNERCLELAPRAVELAPERAHTWAFRGRCHADLGRHEEAVADYEKAAEIGLEDAYLHHNLSLSYLELGRPEEAEAAARHAISLDPAHWDANATLLEALMRQGKVEEALTAWETGEAAIAEDEPDLANDMAWLLYATGEHDRALSIIEPWIEAHPDLTADHVWEANTYAHVLAALGRTEEAIAAFLRAAELGGPEKRASYEANLQRFGFDPGEDDASFEAALRACVATGANCMIDE